MKLKYVLKELFYVKLAKVIDVTEVHLLRKRPFLLDDDKSVFSLQDPSRTYFAALLKNDNEGKVFRLITSDLVLPDSPKYLGLNDLYIYNVDPLADKFPDMAEMKLWRGHMLRMEQKFNGTPSPWIIEA